MADERSCMTTLCYLEKNGSYLMLHRTARKNDVNKDKWIGVGGHFEKGESPEECLLREVREETGYLLEDFRFRGIVTFCTETGLCEYMCLYTSERFSGTPIQCDEGELEWVPKEELLKLKLWEGDKIFFYLLSEEVPFFSLKMRYEGDCLAEVALNGKEMELLDELREDGSRSGVVMERGVAHRDGRLHGTVHIWLVRSGTDGKTEVMLQQRSERKEEYPGCWDVSCAGHRKAGDTCEEAALRELEEELGICAGKEELEWVGWNRSRTEECLHGRKCIDNELTAVYVLRKNPEPEQLRLQEEEVEAVCWMTPEEIIENCKKKSGQYCLKEKEVEMLSAYLK